MKLFYAFCITFIRVTSKLITFIFLHFITNVFLNGSFCQNVFMLPTILLPYSSKHKILISKPKKKTYLVVFIGISNMLSNKSNTLKRLHHFGRHHPRGYITRVICHYKTKPTSQHLQRHLEDI